jgi:hypothetical protein
VAACNEDANEHEALGPDPNIWIVGFEGHELAMQMPARHAQYGYEDGREKGNTNLLHEGPNLIH